MEQTSVCGVHGPLETASTIALKRMHDQFGRNGPLSESQAEKKAEIEAILASRSEVGVSVEENGILHHKV